jgi:hypothetical protein
MTHVDVARTLKELDVIYKDDDDEYGLRFDYKVYNKEISRLEKKGYRVVDEKYLKWSPFLFKRHVLDVIGNGDGESEMDVD